MITRAHDMPFGAKVSEAGVTFRLWAPSAHTVDVIVDGAAQQPMSFLGDGWYEATVTDGHDGSEYRFRCFTTRMLRRSLPQECLGLSGKNARFPWLMVKGSSFGPRKPSLRKARSMQGTSAGRAASKATVLWSSATKWCSNSTGGCRGVSASSWRSGVF
jgi:hypothetical protein